MQASGGMVDGTSGPCLGRCHVSVGEWTHIPTSILIPVLSRRSNFAAHQNPPSEPVSAHENITTAFNAVGTVVRGEPLTTWETPIRRLLNLPSPSSGLWWWLRTWQRPSV